jgi:hypothetical protein
MLAKGAPPQGPEGEEPFIVFYVGPYVSNRLPTK